METQERMMLSKLNFNNYINYVHSECSIPHLDKALYAKLDSTSLETTSKQSSNTVADTLCLPLRGAQPVAEEVPRLVRIEEEASLELSVVAELSKEELVERRDGRRRLLEVVRGDLLRADIPRSAVDIKGTHTRK